MQRTVCTVQTCKMHWSLSLSLNHALLNILLYEYFGFCVTSESSGRPPLATRLCDKTWMQTHTHTDTHRTFNCQLARAPRPAAPLIEINLLIVNAEILHFVFLQLLNGWSAACDLFTASSESKWITCFYSTSKFIELFLCHWDVCVGAWRQIIIIIITRPIHIPLNLQIMSIMAVFLHSAFFLFFFFHLNMKISWWWGSIAENSVAEKKGKRI